MAQGRLERRLHTRLGSHGLVRTGQVSGAWDAALLATADGSAVELRIVGHASTDSGNERAVEVGAVEWKAAAVAGPELYFLRARYYDPSTGRFISREVIGFHQRYAYVSNNPLRWVDASGKCRRSWNPRDWADCALDPITQGKHEDLAKKAWHVVSKIFQTLQTDEFILVADAFALGANTLADTIVVAGTAAGCLGGPVGCAGGAGLTSFVTSPIRGLADVASGVGAYGTCRAEGWSGACRAALARTGGGVLLPDFIPLRGHTSTSSKRVLTWMHEVQRGAKACGPGAVVRRLSEAE